MSKKLLTFELTGDRSQLEIHCNEEGLHDLVSALSRVLATGEHDHLMTPAWGGNELTEEKQGKGNALINIVTIRLWR
jgi:hypothetical protein